jgi:hypothetical protein
MARLGPPSGVPERHGGSSVKLMRIDTYNAYYAALETVDTAQIERSFSEGIEKCDDLDWRKMDSVEEELLSTTPTICHAFIFEAKAKALWRGGKRHEAIEAMMQAFKLHPLPVGVSFLLAKWNLRLHLYVESFLYADLTLELDLMRNDIAFVDAARGIKLVALSNLGMREAAAIILDLLPQDFEMSIDGDLWDLMRLREFVAKS